MQFDVLLSPSPYLTVYHLPYIFVERLVLSAATLTVLIPYRFIIISAMSPMTL
ncbi:MAG: hypothetical protein RXR51_05780 [Nitrososphaeria archaeon]